MVTTYCRFWIRMKESTIYASVGSPSLNCLGVVFGGTEVTNIGAPELVGWPEVNLI